MNELIRKHSDLSNSIIKRAKVTFSHLKTVNRTLNWLLWHCLFWDIWHIWATLCSNMGSLLTKKSRPQDNDQFWCCDFEQKLREGYSTAIFLHYQFIKIWKQCLTSRLFVGNCAYYTVELISHQPHAKNSVKCQHHRNNDSIG